MSDGFEFLGKFEVAIDEKGRIMVPGNWKPFVKQEILICPGCEGAIELWNKESFIKEFQSCIGNKSVSSAVRVIQRKILGELRHINLDKWFRFVIPNSFKKNFQEGVLLVGNGSYIEIWNKKDYEEWAKKPQNSVEKAKQDLEEKNIFKNESLEK